MSSLEASVHQTAQKLVESRVELQGDIAAGNKAIVELERKKADITRLERQLETARAEAERKLVIAQASNLEVRLLPLLSPVMQTMAGTLGSYVPAERLLTVEDAKGQTVVFSVAADLTIRGFCGARDTTMVPGDLKRGAPILVAYVAGGGAAQRVKGTARIAATHTCS